MYVARHCTANQEKTKINKSREREKIIQMLEQNTPIYSNREKVEESPNSTRNQHVQINLTIEKYNKSSCIALFKTSYCMEVARNIMRHI